MIIKSRKGDTPIRITAIEFADGEIIGEERPAASMRENRKAVAEGFAAMLADVRARLSVAGTSRSAQRLALQSLRAEIDQYLGKGKPHEQGTPAVLTGPKSHTYISVDSALHRLTVEVGEEKALEALAAALEAAVKRNKVGH